MDANFYTMVSAITGSYLKNSDKCHSERSEAE